jgi:predicted AlkP superfamily pyrophosphatase or phosphodiesterase
VALVTDIQGVPDVQVVYFPGIDLYTHIADSALHDQVEYFKTLLDPSVGRIVDEYRKQGALDSTYVIVISDHGHTPVLKDERHAFAAKPDACAPPAINLSRLQSASSQNRP